MPSSFDDRRSERLDVDLDTAIIGQRVPARARDDQRRVDERLAGSVDEHVKVGIRIGRGLLAPQDVCQHVAWDECAAPNSQDTHDGPRQPTPEGRRRQLQAVTQDLEATEQPNLERFGAGTVAAGRQREPAKRRMAHLRIR